LLSFLNIGGPKLQIDVTADGEPNNVKPKNSWESMRCLKDRRLKTNFGSER